MIVPILSKFNSKYFLQVIFLPVKMKWWNFSLEYCCNKIRPALLSLCTCKLFNLYFLSVYDIFCYLVKEHWPPKKSTKCRQRRNHFGGRNNSANIFARFHRWISHTQWSVWAEWIFIAWTVDWRLGSLSYQF